MNKYQEALRDMEKLYIDKYNNGKIDEIGFCRIVAPFQELVDRATPKKPIWVEEQLTGEDLLPTWIDIPTCPNCGKQVYYPHCCNDNDCRQAIDWTNESEQIAKGMNDE